MFIINDFNKKYLNIYCSTMKITADMTTIGPNCLIQGPIFKKSQDKLRKNLG